MRKSNDYRKLSNRDDFAFHYYCRRAREFEKHKLRQITKKRNRNNAKKQIKEGLKDGEDLYL